MKNTIYINLFFTLLVFSCNPFDKKDPDPTPTYSAPNPMPNLAGADGALVAIQTLTYTSTPIGDIATPVDVALAIFYETTTAYYNAGSVKVNTHSLNINDDNSYVSVSASSANVDLDFGDDTNFWEVSGSANISAFNHTTAKLMPSDIKFSAEKEDVDVSTPLTVSIEQAPTNADSILYIISSQSKSVQKIVSPYTTSVTFTTADLSGIEGVGVIQVAAYNYELNTATGKNLYYVNETVISDYVTFE